MRLAVLVAVSTLVGLSGCFSHGCAVSERSETWRQADYWTWQPADSLGLEVREQPAEPRWPWPDPPMEWLGNHTVRSAALRVGSGTGSTEHAVSIRDVRGTLGVSAFLPQRMAADDRAAAIREALATATDASDSEVATLVDQAMASDDGGDDTGRILRAQAPGLDFDFAGLAARAGWTVAPKQAGTWEMSNGHWVVQAVLDSRTIQGSGWGHQVHVDAGGHVRGPLLMANLTDAERREATSSLLASWGAPVPTYVGASIEEQMVCV